ncbi:hypothetical protein IQ07DRAFT_583584 [Pyrenochaeta sp. DS3sAY3a]|nr:hypothetical protein IQ07DRAFT_583584 [Pyrenochaeta sp. DS3sAY3a]
MAPDEFTAGKFFNGFLNLPRELRDLIYRYVVAKDKPINITGIGPRPQLAHPIISPELCKAFYENNTVSVTFADYFRIRNNTVPLRTWGIRSQYRRHIRHLIINASESLPIETDLSPEALEYECAVSRPTVRKQWEELLELQSLQSLTINMQKYSTRVFTWANFAPVLYQLRDENVNLKITFNISFDTVLKINWSGPWESQFHDANFDGYESMGFVDVSDLVARPSEEDRAYVEEHVKVRKRSRMDAVEGLLMETAANKRLLAPHYMVKDPPLLRVQMEEHYQVYRKRKEDQRVREGREEQREMERLNVRGESITTR